MGSIRPCRDDERAAILEIVNVAAAAAYRGVIPDDRWRAPYMEPDELEREIEEGVAFWGYEADGELVGVMGIQAVADVDLIRHAYVLPGHQGQGIGGALLGRGEHAAAEPFLVQGYEGLRLREATIQRAQYGRLLEAGERLARLYDETGRPDKARAVRDGIPRLP